MFFGQRGRCIQPSATRPDQDGAGTQIHFYFRTCLGANIVQRKKKFRLAGMINRDRKIGRDERRIEAALDWNNGVKNADVVRSIESGGCFTCLRFRSLFCPAPQLVCLLFTWPHNVSVSGSLAGVSLHYLR